MPEHCPIAVGGMTRDVLSCMEVCEQRWNEAVQKDRNPEQYDTYKDVSDEESGVDCLHADVQFSSDSVHALGKHLRSYVIVDECVQCGIEIGEKGYSFFCPSGSKF